VTAALAAVAATAGPGAASTGAAPAVADSTGPTLRLLDAADAHGKLDLRSVRLGQTAASLVFTFRVNRPFALRELSGVGDRIVCLDIVPRGRPARGRRICLIGRRGAHALYRLAHRDVRARRLHGRGPVAALPRLGGREAGRAHLRRRPLGVYAAGARDPERLRRARDLLRDRAAGGAAGGDSAGRDPRRRRDRRPYLVAPS
jgi:hypothetical protein